MQIQRLLPEHLEQIEFSGNVWSQSYLPELEGGHFEVRQENRYQLHRFDPEQRNTLPLPEVAEKRYGSNNLYRTSSPRTQTMQQRSLYADNKSALSHVRTEGIAARNKHFDIQLQHSRDKQNKEQSPSNPPSRRAWRT